MRYEVSNLIKDITVTHCAQHFVGVRVGNGVLELSANRAAPSTFERRDVFAFNESGVIQAQPQSIDNKREAGSGCASEKPNHRHGWLLRARAKRPRGRRAAEKRDEMAALDCSNHSITSSASASSVGGASIRSALAVLRLMAN